MAMPKLYPHSTGTAEAVINVRRPNSARKELQKDLLAWKAIYSHAYDLNTGVKRNEMKGGKKVK